MKYETVINGEWFEPTPQRGHRMRCCDCGLVHVMNFRVKNGKVQIQPRRDNRATAASRRKLKLQSGSLVANHAKRTKRVQSPHIL